MASFQPRFRPLSAVVSSAKARVAGCGPITTAIAKNSKKLRRSECRIMMDFLTYSMHRLAKRSASFIF